MRVRPHLVANSSLSSPTIQRSILHIHLTAVPLISLIAGILILVMPKLLNYIIAIYLILVGVFGLFGTHLFHLG